MEQSGILQRTSMNGDTNGTVNNIAASLSSSTSSLITNNGLTTSNVPGDRNSIATVTSNGSTEANIVDLDKMFAFLGDLQKSDSRLSIANLNNAENGGQFVSNQTQTTSSSTITSPSLIANCSSNGEQPSPSICSLSSAASVSSSGFSSAMSSTTLTTNNKMNENHTVEDIGTQFDKLIQSTEQQLNELDQLNGKQMLRNASPFNRLVNPNQCFKLPPNYKHVNPSFLSSSSNSRPNSLASDCTLNSYSCSDQTSLNSSLNSSSLPMFRLTQFNAERNAERNRNQLTANPSSQCSNSPPEFNIKNSNSSIYSTSSSFTTTDQTNSSTTTLADLMQQSEQQIMKQNLKRHVVEPKTTGENKEAINGQNNNNTNNGQLPEPAHSLQTNIAQQPPAAHTPNNLFTAQLQQPPQPPLPQQMNGLNKSISYQPQLNSNGTLLLNAALQQQQQQQFIINAMAKGFTQQQAIGSFQQHYIQNMANLKQQPEGHESQQPPSQIDERRKQRVERKMQQLKEQTKQPAANNSPPVKQQQLTGSNDLLEFAEKYFNSHSRDQANSNSMIKTLTRRRRTVDENDVSNKAEMLSYTSVFNIPTSHIRMQEQENSVLACSMFKELCKYMSQLDMKSEPEHRIIQSILSKCIEREELRDELYVQVMRQITNNSNREEVIRLWVLIGLTTAAFTPSKLLARYFIEFLKRNLRKESAIACYAQFSLDNLQPKCAVLNCRHNSPSSQEINSVKNLTSLLVKFHLLDGSTKTVSFTH